MRSKILIFTGLILFAGCYNTELITDHTNPLDRIYDDGDFRIVLNQPERQADGTWLIRWSNVYHKKHGELDDKSFKLSAGAALAYMNAAPSVADIQAIRNRSLAHGFTTEIKQIQPQNGSYAGSFNLGTLTGVTVRSYVIYMSYNYTDPDEVKTSGVLHSNVVVFEP